MPNPMMQMLSTAGGGGGEMAPFVQLFAQLLAAQQQQQQSPPGAGMLREAAKLQDERAQRDMAAAEEARRRQALGIGGLHDSQAAIVNATRGRFNRANQAGNFAGINREAALKRAGLAPGLATMYPVKPGETEEEWVERVRQASQRRGGGMGGGMGQPMSGMPPKLNNYA